MKTLSQKLNHRYTRPPLYKKQVNAIFNKKRIACIEASTKAGKTYGCIAWLLEQALIHGAPGKNYWWCAPVYAQCLIAYRRMYRALPIEVYEANKTEMTITLFNGAMIFFKSCKDDQNLYGEDVYACVIDEASRVSNEACHAIYTTLKATKGYLRLIGNVRGRHNFHYDICRKIQSGAIDGAYSKMTAYDAVEGGVLDAKEIEDAKVLLPEHVFKELFLAEPSDDGGNPFGQQNIDKAVRPLSSLPAVNFGLDIARKKDWTVLIGLDANGHVCEFHRFQKPWNEVIEFVIRVVNSKPCLVDSTSMGGDIFIEAVQRAGGPNFTGFIFTPRSKQDLMECLSLCFSQGRIGIIEGPLKMELETFEYKYTRTHTFYSAPIGFHDDCVCALALAAFKMNAKPSFGAFTDALLPRVVHHAYGSTADF